MCLDFWKGMRQFLQGDKRVTKFLVDVRYVLFEGTIGAFCIPLFRDSSYHFQIC